MVAIGFAERQLNERQHLEPLVPQQARVQLAPLDQLLDDRSLLELLVDELHPLREIVVVLHHRGLGDADRRVLERSEEHTSELQSRLHLVCRLLLEKKKTTVK